MPKKSKSSLDKYVTRHYVASGKLNIASGSSFDKQYTRGFVAYLATVECALRGLSINASNVNKIAGVQLDVELTNLVAGGVVVPSESVIYMSSALLRFKKLAETDTRDILRAALNDFEHERVGVILCALAGAGFTGIKK